MSRTGDAALNAAQTPERPPSPPARTGWAAVAGLAGAIGASSCCILPLALLSLGAGGAWISNLTALSPYQPFFIALTLGVLGYGFFTIYRSRRRGCSDSAACDRGLSDRTVKIALWAAALLVAAAVAFPYVAPWLLGIR